MNIFQYIKVVFISIGAVFFMLIQFALYVAPLALLVWGLALMHSCTSDLNDRIVESHGTDASPKEILESTTDSLSDWWNGN